MHVEDQVMYFLNDMCCEVGWSGRKKFLVEAVVGLLCGCYMARIGKGTCTFSMLMLMLQCSCCCFFGGSDDRTRRALGGVP